MPKTSIKTFLILLHKLNSDMEKIASEGALLLEAANQVDFDSITAPTVQDELNETFNETGNKFRELNDMKQVLLRGLQINVINKLDAAPMSSRIKSARLNSSRSSSRKTRRFRSI